MSGRLGSEEEDNPEPFEGSSGEDWKEEDDKGGRRKSSRLSTKPKRKFVDSGDSNSEEPLNEDDDFDSEEDKPPKRRKVNNKSNGRNAPKPPAKPKKELDSASEEDFDEEDEDEDDEFTDDSNNSGDSSTLTGDGKSNQRKFLPKTIFSDDYAAGSFVISKKDLKALKTKKQPCIWRIDGKALLQKYEVIEEEGKVRHKNTSIYTGWSTIDKDIYAPVTVDVIKHNNSNLTVELHWDKLNE